MTDNGQEPSFGTKVTEKMTGISMVKVLAKRLALALAITVNFTPSAFSQVMMSSDTESELGHKITPPKGIIDLVIQSEPDDANLLKECSLNGGQKKIPASEFFSVAQIRLNNDNLPDYFVRPAIRPYCSAFYGAHLFRYRFVISYRKEGKIGYRIVFKSGGDEVHVLSHVTNGYHDLELVGHNAIKVQTSTWRFDGRKYIAAGCFMRDVNSEDPGISSC